MPGADAPYRAGVEDAEVRVSPMVGMTAALVCGILAAPLLPELAVWTPFVAGGWLTIWAFLLRRRPALSFLCLLMVFATFGATRAKHCGTPAPDDVSRLAGYPSQYLVGTVAAEPEPTGDNGVRYPLHVFAGGDGRPLSGSIAVSQSANAGAVPRYGDWLVARGRVETPRTATNPGGFDYRAYLWRKSTFATIAAKRAGDVGRYRPFGGAPRDRAPLAIAAAVRRALLTSVAESPLPKGDKALVSGVLLSEQGAIAYADRLAFERSGAVHVLSVSGLHLAVFATVLAYGTRLLPASRALRNSGNVLAVLLLWTFALAAGFASATVRSALMLSVVLLAPVFRRDADPLHSLVVAAFGILLCDPLALYDIGAQLSFACVGGLLLWTHTLSLWMFPLEAAMPWHVRAMRGGVFLFGSGFVAQVAAVPLMAYHFSHVSLIAPVANLVAVPVSEGLLLAGLATAGMDALFAVPTDLWQPVHWLCALLMVAVRGFAVPEFAAVSVPPPPVWSMGAFYGTFVALGFVFRHFATRRTIFPDTNPRLSVPRLAAFPVAALLVLPTLIVALPILALRAERAGANRLRVTFLDVGQGDAAVVEAPDGAVMVVDGGGFPGFSEANGGDPGSRVVVPFLRRRGINRVDILAPSHPDDDHVQGLIAVARAFPIGTVLDSGVADGGGSCARLRELLRQKHVSAITARRGQTIALGTSGVALDVLHPALPFLRNTRSDTNANSVVLRVRYRAAAVLFTGDAEEAAEESLLRSGVSLKADVLKVGHHGSRSSSGAAFLKAVRPSVAIISCGRDNNFGHPAPNVLAKLGVIHAATYRTDRIGAIVVETDGARVFVSPAAPQAMNNLTPP